MTNFLPIILCAALIVSILAIIGWPWLKAKEHREKAGVALAVTFFLTMALYLQVGSPFTVDEMETQKIEHETVLARITELENASGGDEGLRYAELGAAYIHSEQYGKAADALKEAVLLSGGNPKLILMYGKAQMMAADGEITADAKQAFEMAEKLMPDNYEPALMLAMERMQAGDKDGARERMRALLPKLPEGIPLRRMIEQQLKEE